MCAEIKPTGVRQLDLSCLADSKSEATVLERLQSLLLLGLLLQQNCAIKKLHSI